MAVLWGLVGLVVGSVLNLLIYRLPRLEKLAAPIQCPKCRVRRPFYTQSAVLALLLGRRGRCGGCDAGPDRLALLAEVATGIAFYLLFLRFGPTPSLLLYSLYTSLLVMVFFIDWQHRLIPNRITYPGLILALLLTPLLSPVTLSMTLLGMAIGGLSFGLLYAGGYLLYRQEVLGLGDVKLATMLGAMMGFPGIMAALLFGSFLGAVAAVALLISRRSSGRDFMPYGTALCLGAFAALLLDLPFLN